MTGDELCALLGSSQHDPNVKRALAMCVEVEIDDDGDGHAEAMDAHGFQIDFGGGFVIGIQLIREHFHGALPEGLTWDGEPSLSEIGRTVQGDPVYETGAYQLTLVHDEGEVSALVAAESILRV